MKSYTLMLAAALALAACKGQPENTPQAASQTAPAASNTAEAASAAAPAGPISSKDGVFQFTADGNFSDSLNESSLHPENLGAEQITLLQYDADRNLTLTAVQYGKAEGDSKAVFSKIKAQIEKEKTLANVKIGEAKDAQMTYSFERKTGEDTTSESCIAHVSAEKQVSSICASSTELSADDLAKFLAQTVQVKS
ncbi:hypothetical protein [Kingella denitrificans]|uniref:hypothetical protein n=1 Tax=Kingella denitrificans TaxID=502 RepID=UPI0028D6FFD4|nr:hypothetical protein [Kingella denitrificans]